ncbi:rho GTPase-activating protein 12-like isoform X1, partial [Clarias magur]
MADCSDLAVAPGQPFVEVEYDYEYKFKDRMITIKQGERYLLVKKTNEDWWQVRKEEGSKPFYVPAQYVREVRRALMPPTKPLLHTGGGVGARRGSDKKVLTALELKQSDESLTKQSPAYLSVGYPQALHAPKEDNASPKSPRRQETESPVRLRAPLNLDEETNGDGEKKRQECDGEREKKKEGGGDRRREEQWTGNRERKRDGGWDRVTEMERKREGEVEDKLKEQRREVKCDRDGEKAVDVQKKKEGERAEDGQNERKFDGGQLKTASPEEFPREATKKYRHDLESGDELSSSSTEQLQ